MAHYMAHYMGAYMHIWPTNAGGGPNTLEINNCSEGLVRRSIDCNLKRYQYLRPVTFLRTQMVSLIHPRQSATSADSWPCCVRRRPCLVPLSTMTGWPNHGAPVTKITASTLRLSEPVLHVIRLWSHCFCESQTNKIAKEISGIPATHLLIIK